MAIWNTLDISHLFVCIELPELIDMFYLKCNEIMCLHEIESCASLIDGTVFWYAYELWIRILFIFNENFKIILNHHVEIQIIASIIVKKFAGTDDDLPPSHQNRFQRAGRTSGNGRSAPVGSAPLPRIHGDMETQIHLTEQEAYCLVLWAFIWNNTR